MAKITKLIKFLEACDLIIKWYPENCKTYKIEALDELKELIFEVVEKAEAIKNKEYY